MTATFKYDEVTGAISLSDGATLRWSTDYAPALLLPDANKIEVTSHVISFPDFVKSNMMWMSAWTSGFDYTDAMSWVNILPGEWGPDAAAAPYILSRELLGAVPDGVNYLDVRVNLTRTTAPSQYQGAAVTPTIKEGDSVFADGGFLVLERAPGWVRAIKIRLIGTTEATALGITAGVYLERFQSVRNNPYCTNDPTVIKSGTQIWTSGGYAPWDNLWTYGGAAVSSAAGFLAYLIQTVTSGNINKQRGGVNAPSTTDPTDYTSVYTGTITVRPGKVDDQDAVTPAAPVAPSPMVVLAADGYKFVLTSGSILADLYIYGVPFGDLYADSKVILGVVSIVLPTSVKINGTAATRIDYGGTDAGYVISWWEFDAPAGVSCSIEISRGTSGTMYAYYGLFVISGFGTFTEDNLAYNVALAGAATATATTINGGFALGAARSTGSSSTSGTITVDGQVNSSGSDYGTFGHALADGTNESLGVGGSGSAASVISFS